MLVWASRTTCVPVIAVLKPDDPCVVVLPMAETPPLASEYAIAWSTAHDIAIALFNDAVIAISTVDVLECAVGLLLWTLLRSACKGRRRFRGHRASKSSSDEKASPGDGRNSSSLSETSTSSADTSLNSVSSTRFATAAGSRSSPAGYYHCALSL